MEGGIASGFKKVEVGKVEPRLFIVKGRRTVRVTQVWKLSMLILYVSSSLFPDFCIRYLCRKVDAKILLGPKV